MDENINKLIEEGKLYTFENNCEVLSHGTFSTPSSNLLAWITKVDNFIKNTYGENSSAYTMFRNFSLKKINGYTKDGFYQQMNIINGALKSCYAMKPMKSKKPNDNMIIKLLKNPFYWASIVVLIGAAFWLGFYFSAAKFDKEKTDMYQENINLKKLNEQSKQTVNELKQKILLLTK